MQAPGISSAQSKDQAMRDFRDAKAMARTLREALGQKGCALSHTDCLELTARSFGLKDWHVLAAMIEADSASQVEPAPAPAPSPRRTTMRGFKKIDSNVAVSDDGFTVRAGRDIEYIENGAVTIIDAVQARDGGILLYAHAHGFRAIPDGARIYQNVARALAFLGKQPELWNVAGRLPRRRSLAPNAPETAPTDGRFLDGDFRKSDTDETTRWAVAWDRAAGAWVTRLGHVVKPAWLMEGWAPTAG
jgi:hypothetical protein